MKVSADYICEHGMPQPWATCTDCMLLPHAMQPKPPRPAPEPDPGPKKRPSRAKKPGEKATKTGQANTGRSSTGRSGTAKAKAEPRVSTRLPKAMDDMMPPLAGTKDLAYEIPEVNLRHHVQGADKNWLPISTMPKDLREGGWVYLQVDSDLVARCRVKGVGFRERRWTHENAEQTSDAGPGPTLEVYGDDWEFLSIDLGREGAAPVDGYRYVLTDGDVVRMADSDPS